MLVIFVDLIYELHAQVSIIRVCWFVIQSGVDLKNRALSPALRAVVWTLLSCGILLSLFFLIFTLRFKNNR